MIILFLLQALYVNFSHVLSHLHFFCTISYSKYPFLFSDKLIVVLPMGYLLKSTYFYTLMLVTGELVLFHNSVQNINVYGCFLYMLTKEG